MSVGIPSNRQARKDAAAAEVGPIAPGTVGADLALMPDIVISRDTEQLKGTVDILARHKTALYARPSKIGPTMPDTVGSQLPIRPNSAVRARAENLYPAIRVDRRRQAGDAGSLHAVPISPKTVGTALPAMPDI